MTMYKKSRIDVYEQSIRELEKLRDQLCDGRQHAPVEISVNGAELFSLNGCSVQLIIDELTEEIKFIDKEVSELKYNQHYKSE